MDGVVPELKWPYDVDGVVPRPYDVDGVVPELKWPYDVDGVETWVGYGWDQWLGDADIQFCPQTPAGHSKGAETWMGWDQSLKKQRLELHGLTSTSSNRRHRQ